MTPVTCTDVDRYKGLPLYTVKVYDIDNPVNFHSYDCIFFEQGFDLEELLEEANERIKQQQNQERSEEENKRIDRIINILDWAEEKGRISYSDWDDCVTYVKCLRPQNHWKPSEEQLTDLYYAAKQLSETRPNLQILYNDLVKL